MITSEITMMNKWVHTPLTRKEYMFLGFKILKFFLKKEKDKFSRNWSDDLIESPLKMAIFQLLYVQAVTVPMEFVH